MKRGHMSEKPLGERAVNAFNKARRDLADVVEDVIGYHPTKRNRR